MREMERLTSGQMLANAIGGTKNGTNQVFTVAGPVSGTTLMSWYQGLLMKRVAATGDNTGADTFYHVSGETAFTIGAAPESGDDIVCHYLKA